MLLKSFVYYIAFLLSIFSSSFSLDVSEEAASLKVWNSFLKMYPLLSVINSDESFLQRQDIVNSIIEELMLQEVEEDASIHSNVYKYLYNKSPMLANVYKSYYDLNMPLILNKSPYQKPQFILNGESFDLDEIYYLKSDKLVPNAEHYNVENSKQPIIGSVENLIKNLGEKEDEVNERLYQAKYINNDKPLLELHCSLNEEFFELFVMEATEGKFNLVWYDTSNITFFDPKENFMNDLYELKYDNVEGLSLNGTDIVSDTQFKDKQRSNQKGFLSNLDIILTLKAIEQHVSDPWETLDVLFNNSNDLPFSDYQQQLSRDFNLNKEDVLAKKDSIIQRDLNTLKHNGISYDNIGLYVNGINILNNHASRMGVLDAIIYEFEMMNGLKNSILKVFPQLSSRITLESVKKLLLEYEVMYSKFIYYGIQNTHSGSMIV